MLRSAQICKHFNSPSSGSSPPVHHLWPPLWTAEHHIVALYPTQHGGLHTLILSCCYTQKISSSALKTLSLIIAPNLEDGHWPNLLVLLSNHLIPNDYTVDHRPNLLVQLCNHLILNDYTVERSRRRSFHCLSGKNLVHLNIHGRETSNKFKHLSMHTS